MERLCRGPGCALLDRTRFGRYVHAIERSETTGLRAGRVAAVTLRGVSLRGKGTISGAIVATVLVGALGNGRACNVSRPGRVVTGATIVVAVLVDTRARNREA